MCGKGGLINNFIPDTKYLIRSDSIRLYQWWTLLFLSVVYKTELELTQKMGIEQRAANRPTHTKSTLRLFVSKSRGYTPFCQLPLNVTLTCDKRGKTNATLSGGARQHFFFRNSIACFVLFRFFLIRFVSFCFVMFCFCFSFVLFCFFFNSAVLLCSSLPLLEK